MHDEILYIGNVPVFVRNLHSGDMKVWHPYNDHVREIVEPICRNRGRWHPGFNNWVVYTRHSLAVLTDLRKAAEGKHGA